MAINTIKFSEFASGGDLQNNETTVGLYSGSNAQFNNPWTFLAPGTTAARPTPSSEIDYRLRLNTDLQQYEFYDPMPLESPAGWTQLDDSGVVTEVLALLASNAAGEGASLIGLQDQTGVTSQTVQDLADAAIIAQTDNGTLTNGVFLSSLSTGMMGVTTGTGVLASRVLTGTANQITVTNGNGAANPTFSLPSTLVLPGTLRLGGNFDSYGFDFTNSLTNGGFSFTTSGSGLWQLNATQGINGISNDSTFAADSTELVPTQAAVKAYADTIASGFTPVAGGPCVCSTTDNLDATYSNGVSGVGATLTMNAVGVFTADGVTPTINQRILVPFQTNEAQNGIYQLSTVGNGSTAAILTRVTDYDTSAEITAGSMVAVKAGGEEYGGTVWVETSTVATIGTDAITFQLLSQPSNTFVTLATNQAITGIKTFTNGTLKLGGSVSGYTLLEAAGVAGATTITLPATTDTVVTNSYSATLTNKTLNFNNNTILNVPVSALANNTAGALISWTGLGAVTTINPGTVGYPLISSGTGNLSTYAQLPIASVADATAGSIFAWDSSGNATTISPGTEGYVLTSNGAGAEPTYQAAPSATTTAPTMQVFTSGSGTYTTPDNVVYIKVQLIGGGGGGSGGGISGAGAGSAGAQTLFGSSLLSATGGSGAAYNAGLGGSGGTGTILSPAYGFTSTGGYGQGGSYVSSTGQNFTETGGCGGDGFFGGAGGGGTNASSGASAAANTGAGGGGGGCGGTTLSYAAGSGGGAGGYVEAYINSPSATYTYTVGAGGSGGSAGSYGGAGGAGGSGYIIVTEYY